MKIILLALLLALFTSVNFAQGEFIIILQGSTTGGTNRDSIPTQFAFTDSINATASTQIISKPLVLSGYDSAYVNVTGGDYKIGALGSITRTATIINLGDTLFAVDTSSASNSTATNVIFTIGGVVDTFSVTTVVGGDTLGTEIITYGDMETAGEWQSAFGATIARQDTVKQAGTYAYSVVGDNGTGLDQPNRITAADSTYWLEFDIYVVSASSENVRFRYNGVTIWNSQDTPITEDAWVHVKTSFVSTGADASILFLAYNGAGWFYVDNVSLKKRLY